MFIYNVTVTCKSGGPKCWFILVGIKKLAYDLKKEVMYPQLFFFYSDAILKTLQNWPRVKYT